MNTSAKIVASLILLTLVSCGGSGSSGGSNPSAVDTPTTSACLSVLTASAEAGHFCHANSWIAGVTEYCDGALVYRDYLYDAYGADAPIPTLRWNPLSVNALVLPSGDARYPDGDENSADLVSLTLVPTGDEVAVTAQLNTLYRADQTLVAIAVDSDHNLQSGGGQWPEVNVQSQGWEQVYVLKQADVQRNQIVGVFPRPSGEQWRVWAVVAQADGTVMNLAFRGQHETSDGAWFDQQQATALASGNIDDFYVTVCNGAMEAGLTAGEVIAPGLHERVYTSAYTLPPGEGISVAGIPGPGVGDPGFDPRVYQSFNFLGPYQPYAIYIPDQQGPHGLQIIMHGFSQTHVANISEDSVQQAFGEGLNRILISPLGRGLAGAYNNISERDVLDSIDDAKQAYNIDEDKVIVSGISMGGYGQLQFASQYPDRFAGFIGWVSPTGNFSTYPAGQTLTYIPGSLPVNTAELVPNVRHLPGVLRYGALDEFVLVTEAQAYLNVLQTEGSNPFDFDVLLTAEHLTTFGSDQQIEADLSANWVRPQRVARVDYIFDPKYEVPEYQLFHNRAYWLSEIASREQAAAEIRLHSHSCGLMLPILSSGVEQGFGPPPHLWNRHFRRVSGSEQDSGDALLTGSLSNTASLTLDVAPSCLEGGFAYQLNVDGATQINFSDGRQLSLPAAGQYSGRL